MLNPGTLANLLADVYNKKTGNSFLDARAFANAYTRYASAATSCAAGVPAPQGEPLMATTLATGLLASAGQMSILAQAWAVAVDVFWTAPPVVFAAAVPGAVVSPPGTVSLLAYPLILQAMVQQQALALAKQTSPFVMAKIMATALDVATKTVIVLHPIPVTPCTGTII